MRKKEEKKLTTRAYFFYLMFCVPFWLVVLCFGIRKSDTCDVYG